MTGSTIPGVAYGSVERHADERGSFRELWRRSRLPEPFVQANLSTSAAGVLRGLHLHRRQVDHWVVADGHAFVALVDVRPLLDGSGPQPIVETRELEADESVTIPVGVAHGFLAVERLALLYLVTNEFDGSDELGFAWDDPAVGVPWPQVRGTADGRPILSAGTSRTRHSPSWWLASETDLQAGPARTTRHDPGPHRFTAVRTAVRRNGLRKPGPSRD